ncbi:MAG TPA: hypothetical protein VJ783_31150 [Pirellulales bacterium]|nr:hypothetical protein [Pirellulales bacterium]
MASKVSTHAWLSVFAVSAALGCPMPARASGGRHLGPSDQPPTGQQGPAQSGYGRATIYRSGELPKPPGEPGEPAKPDVAPVPRQPGKKATGPALPVIIQGVPHRFRLHYSQTAC